MPVGLPDQVSAHTDELARFSKEHHIRRLSLFGSALRNDFGPDSDIDVLVQFEPGRVPGLIEFARLEEDLERILGRRTDLVTPASLSRYFRDRVIAQALPIYDRAG